MREERGRDDELVDGKMEAETMAGHDADGVTSDGVNIRHQIGSAEVPGGSGKSHHCCQVSKQHLQVLTTLISTGRDFLLLEVSLALMSPSSALLL